MRTEGETLTFTDIPDKAQVQVFLNDGTSFTGTLRQSAGWPWVSVQGGGTIQPGVRLAQVRRSYRGHFGQAIHGGADAEIRRNCIHPAKNEAGIRTYAVAARSDG